MSSLGATLKMYRDFFKGFWRYRERLKKDDQWIHKYAAAKGLRVNPHKMFYTNLKIWIEKNRDLYEKQYCPCFEPSGDPALDRKLICPCAFAEADIAEHGTCHCVLFGRADLTDEEFSAAEALLQQEYRPKLNLMGNRLDTRGQPKAPKRGLDVPDAMHQVKQALNHVSGDLVVLVDRAVSVENLKRLAEFRQMGFSSRELEPGLFEVTLRRS